MDMLQYTRREDVMYLKLVKSKNYTYLKICESYRKNGKVHQRVLVNLGRLDKLQEGGLENIVKDLEALISPDKKEKIKDISTMEEVARFNYGFLPYAKLWHSLGIGKILKGLVKERKFAFDFEKVVFSLVANRLLNPTSKHKHYHQKDDYLFLNKDLELHTFYKVLDILEENKEEIEFKLFENARSLFNLKLDIVFYDVTTFYFESQKEDELKDFGFSKDNKVNQVQVVMGLLIDKEGRPIGYELFKGNMVDSQTMISTIKKLKEKFMIDRIIIVADRGLNTKLNLKELRDNGFDYIVSGRLKQMPRDIQEVVLDREGYERIGDEYEYKEINYTNVIKNGDFQGYAMSERLIATYSMSRAQKDFYDRERLIRKAKTEIKKGKSALEEKKGHKKYIKKVSQGEADYQLVLDEERIRQEERFDGFYVIQTSDFDLSVDEVIDAYHNLWRVEESFRIMKSTMQVRPIFHWTQKRVEGHFVMCFIAFLLCRELELRLRKNKKTQDMDLSVEKIQDALNSLQVSEIKIEDKPYFLKGKHKELASKILAIMKIPQLKHLSSLDEITAWYSEFSGFKA